MAFPAADAAFAVGALPRPVAAPRAVRLVQEPPASPHAASSGRQASIGVLSAAAAASVAAAAAKRRSAKKARKPQSSSVRLAATALEEAPQRIAEAAIDAAVKAVDKDLPGNEDLDDEGCRVSYVSRQRLEGVDVSDACEQVDEDGLPLVYSVTKLNEYWGQYPGELTGRWGDFLGLASPWIARTFGSAVQGRLEQDEKQLASDAVDAIQELGPTFIKLGQVLSIRPDLLSPAVMAELGRLQDRIETFDSDIARSMIEKELGQPISEVFSELSDEPIAAASLAQVYKGKLKSNGAEVAVKVQRPGALPTISKDLYVMRKAAGVVTNLSQTLTAQTTDFKAFTETFGEGLYTELDFRNEALNQIKMAKLIKETEGCGGVIVPSVYLEHTTRRVLVSEWINGTKLSDLPAERIKAGIADAQNVFLNQLLVWGFFHGDPHPGNLLYVNEGPNEGKLCLLDFGLVAQIPKEDREYIVTAVVHVGSKNWEGLVEDFIKLQFLPADCNRAVVIPVMKRVLGPYLKGGGAKAMNFTALGADLLQATLEIPFSIPPYVSLLARSVATLEGIALKGDEDYRLVGEAYPFVVRRLLQAPDGSVRLTQALRDLLVDEKGRVRPVRLSAMLQAAVGVTAASGDQEGFIDFDAVPKDGADVEDLIKFLLSPAGKNLKPVLVKELATTMDLIVRSAARRAYQDFESSLPRLPGLGPPPQPPLPVLTPRGPKLMTPKDMLDVLQPKLSRDEEVYMQSNAQVFMGLLGVPIDPKKGIDVEIQPRRILEVLGALASQKDDDMQRVFTNLLSKRRGRGIVTEWWGDLATDLRDLWGSRLQNF